MKIKKSFMDTSTAENIDTGETNGKGEGCVTCSGQIGAEHLPITFAGHFRALCPLCAALALNAEMAEDVNHLENAQEEAKDAAARVKELENRETRYNKLMAELADDAAGLVAAAKMVQDAFVHEPGDTAGNKARTAPLKYANGEFAPALRALRTAIDKIEKGGHND